MSKAGQEDHIIHLDDPIVITGANGFIGSRLVAALLDLGYSNLRCFTRPSRHATRLDDIVASNGQRIKIFHGNLLSRNDCAAVTEDATVIYHLAAGRGEKSIPDAFLNSVVTTRNLLEASLQHGCLKRFVNVSSFTVYTNTNKRCTRLLDEDCPVETQPELRGEAYCFAKSKQDAIVAEYGEKFGLPFVIVRPGFVYGPGNTGITGRVGLGTFGMFLHFGGPNKIPLSYVDNCADAIALAGLIKDVNGEVFNVVDDDLLSSREFLRLYKHNVKRFRSIYIPHLVSYALCFLWERYSAWSQGQLPPAFNRRVWNAMWKKTEYSNQKLKLRLGWRQRVPTSEGLTRYFEACRAGELHA